MKTKKIVTEITARFRIAFLITCLETYMEKSKTLDNAYATDLLDNLRNFSTKTIPTWLKDMQVFDPKSVLNEDFSKDCDYCYMLGLKEFYQKAPNDLLEMIKAILLIRSYDPYREKEITPEDNLMPLEKILNIMEKHNLPLPKHIDLKKFDSTCKDDTGDSTITNKTTKKFLLDLLSPFFEFFHFIQTKIMKTRG